MGDSFDRIRINLHILDFLSKLGEPSALYPISKKIGLKPQHTQAYLSKLIEKNIILTITGSNSKRKRYFINPDIEYKPICYNGCVIRRIKIKNGSGLIEDMFVVQNCQFKNECGICSPSGENGMGFGDRSKCKLYNELPDEIMLELQT